jgi:flagellar protein FlbB
MAKEKFLAEKEKMNPFLWFLFAIVIPVIIAITLTVVVFAVAGVDVVSWAKNTGNNIPVLSSIITTDDEAREKTKKESIESRLDAKDAEIEKVSQEKKELEGTVEQLKQQITKLERDLDAASQQQPEAVEDNKTVKQISNSFTNMKGKQAALILEQLEPGTAYVILSEMSNDDRGSILENMSPEVAAEITKFFINAN